MKRKVKKVIDGDTFETYRKTNGSKFVRLAGVNAPEKHQFGGTAATNKLKNMIGGKVVSVNPVGRSYGRVVANVSVKRRSVNRRLK